MPDRTLPDDPNRCKASSGKAQCPYRSTANSDYCENHGGKQQLAVSERRHYDIGASEQLSRISDLSTSSFVVDLRDEIAMVKRLLELTIEQSKSNTDYLLRAPQIQAYTKSIADLQKLNAELSVKYGELLTKQQVARMVSTLIETCLVEISDLPNFEEVSDRIVQRCAELLTNTTNET